MPTVRCPARPVRGAQACGGDRSSLFGRVAVPAIVSGLLDLAKTLQMKTVAEGVEQDVQRDSLRDQSCDFGQGFLFDQPLDAVGSNAVGDEATGHGWNEHVS